MTAVFQLPWLLGVLAQLIQLALCATYLRKRLQLDWTVSLVGGQVSLWLAKLVLAEVASIAGWFSVMGVFVIDALLTIGLAMLLVLTREPLPKTSFPQLKGAALISAIAIAAGIFFHLLMVILVAQSNWDSLTYHLPRSATWLQNGSLEFFETTNLRENVSQILPSVLYSFSLAYSPVGVGVAFPSLIALILVLLSVRAVVYALTRNESSAMLAALFVASIPMVAVESTTTQTDLLGSVAIATLLAVIARHILRRKSELDWVTTTGIALATAFAVATKLTVAIVLFPLLFAFPWLAQLQRKIRALFVAGSLSALAIAMTSGPYLWRLLSAWDQSSAGTLVLVDRLTFGGIAGNVLKNLGAMAQLPVEDWGAHIRELLQKLTNWWGMELNPEHANFPNSPEFFVIDDYSGDSLGALLHLLLVIVGFIVLASRWKGSTWAWSWFGIGVAQFFLLSLAVRWQPWITRFLFPTFYAFGVFFGLLSHRWHRLVTTSLAVILGALLVVLSVWPPSRSVLPRPEWNADTQNISWQSSSVSGDYFDPISNRGLLESVTALRTGLTAAQKYAPQAVEVVAGGDTRKFQVWTVQANIHPSTPVVNLVGESRIQGVVVRVCLVECEATGTGETLLKDLSEGDTGIFVVEKQPVSQK